MAVPAQPRWQFRGRPGSDIRPRYLAGGGGRGDEIHADVPHARRALERFEVDDRACAVRIQGPETEHWPLRRRRLVEHERLGCGPLSIRPDRLQPADRALGRHSMAAAAKSEPCAPPAPGPSEAPLAVVTSL